MATLALFTLVKRLLSKLRSYGICDIIIDWIGDFLQARKFRVRVRLGCSDWSYVISGIPQGSVLGPLLFLIYINDLILLCQTHSDIYAFADCDTLQGGITALHNWTKDWLLKLNVNKCKVVSFGRNVNNSYVYELIKKQSVFISGTY